MSTTNTMECLRHIQTKLSDAVLDIDTVVEYMQTLTTNCQRFDTENTRLKSLIQEKDDIISQLQSDMNKYLQQIQQLEDEKTAFSRVSHIIAMEKENSRLKHELDTLTSKLNMYATQKTTQHDVSLPQQEAVVTSITEDSVCQTATDEATQFKEKKIKGTVYYMSVNDNILYEKLDNGEVGTRVGHLTETSTGKFKVQWDEHTTTSR